jgi:hypothetical protein
MRYILSAAFAAASICGISMSSAAAEPTHYAGGPVQENNLCWVSTNSDMGFGYWQACAPAPQGMHRKKGS